MDFSFSHEQEQFRDSLARFLRDKSPTSAVRKLMATDRGYDPAVWRQLCDDLGVAGLHLPEDVGGSGYGPVELGIALEEQGRALLCAPYLASAVMAGYAVLLGGTEAQRAELLPGIAGGTTIATLAVTESEGLWRAGDVRLAATASGDGFRLNGRKRFVVDGQNADLLVVAGRTGKGVSLFAVDAAAEGVSRRAVPPMDPTRKLAEIVFDDAPSRLLGAEGEAPLEAILDAVLVAFAHEMIGGAQALLDSAVAYAKLRVQFGRPIGSFQAIKHRCADLLVQVELAKAAVYQAAQLLADGEDATVAASQAKAVAAEAYMHAARECIQFHGGIGFTWENDTHLWFKRAKSSEVFLGAPREHRERMLQAMGV
ncbi:MAG: acyl-CoA dehydrogenase [Alphaproteobacteria bacterium]|nr:acyl-CoA dehydrogenase [Alphaproteobacteria bacterium]